MRSINKHRNREAERRMNKQMIKQTETLHCPSTTCSCFVMLKCVKFLCQKSKVVMSNSSSSSSSNNNSSNSYGYALQSLGRTSTWNALPAPLRNDELSAVSFRHQLKTELYIRALARSWLFYCKSGQTHNFNVIIITIIIIFSTLHYSQLRWEKMRWHCTWRPWRSRSVHQAPWRAAKSLAGWCRDSDSSPLSQSSWTSCRRPSDRSTSPYLTSWQYLRITIHSQKHSQSANLLRGVRVRVRIRIQ